MIPKRAIFSLSLFLPGLLISCDRTECKNTNPIFHQFQPETKEYKDELVQQLRLTDDATLSYWFDQYKEDNGLKYLIVRIQGEGLCAKGLLSLKKQDDKLEGIFRTKGAGYRGAELKKLRFGVYQDSVKTELIYLSIERIVD